jgi:hypothetical protein
MQVNYDETEVDPATTPFVAPRLYWTFFLYLLERSAAVLTDAFALRIS